MIERVIWAGVEGGGESVDGSVDGGAWEEVTGVELVVTEGVRDGFSDWVDVGKD